MSGRAPEGLLRFGRLDDRLEVGGPHAVAWDVLGNYGAVLSAWVSAEGEISFEADILECWTPGRWRGVCGGGSGSVLKLEPPLPPQSVWPFAGLLVMGTVGLDVAADDDSDAALDAVFGILAPPACSVAVRRDGRARVVEAFPGSRAFVALTLGRERARLTPYAEDRRRVGDEVIVGHRFSGAL